MSEIDEATLEVYEYLDLLQEIGSTNMFGAGSYIEEQFDVSPEVARKLLLGWMDSYAERHPE